VSAWEWGSLLVIRLAPREAVWASPLTGSAPWRNWRGGTETGRRAWSVGSGWQLTRVRVRVWVGVAGMSCMLRQGELSMALSRSAIEMGCGVK